MFPNDFPGLNINDLTGLNNNSYCDDNLGFYGLNWNGAGPSQPYLGVDVQGNLDNYPKFSTPSTTPTFSYPTHGVFPDEGYNSPFHQGAAMSSFSSQQTATTLPLSIKPPFTTTSPVPILVRGSPSLSPETYAAPITPTHHSHSQPQPIPNPGDFGFDFSTATGGFSLPAVHSSPPHNPPYEELWGQYQQSYPLHLDTPSSHLITGAAPPEVYLPPPVASSSGPERTRRPAREARRHDPMKLVKKADSKIDGWNQTLIRFQARFNTLYSVQNGQPSGGLVPEMALAEVDKFTKEDLKQSPLQNMKAGEGKRSRDVEDYLKGLLKAIRPVELAPIPAGAGSDENGTMVAALSRLADELEAQLTVVDQRPTLRQSAHTARPGQRVGGEQAGKRMKKNELEKARRGCERHHLERISRLFKAPQQQRSKKEVLSFAVLFLVYGPKAFPHDFVKVRPIASGL